jgi:hypothetical protein
MMNARKTAKMASDKARTKKNAAWIMISLADHGKGIMLNRN